MAKEIDYEKCIKLAQKRLQDVITAANKADDNEMAGLMLSSMCGEESEFTKPDTIKQAELTLNGDCREGIYFVFNGYNFHITKDSEYNSKYHSDLYHVWCECDFFKDEEMPMKHVYVNWLCGALFLEEKHKAYILGEIPQQEFEQYLWDDVNICVSNWLEKNKEFIKYE